MTFQKAVAEMRRLQQEFFFLEKGDPTAGPLWLKKHDAERRVDHMLSEMSREMDMEKFDKEVDGGD